MSPRRYIDPVVCRIPKTEEEKAQAESLDSSETGTWRIFRIMAEFVTGFHFIARFHKAVTIFGSGRAQVGDHYYQSAVNLGRALGKNGYTVITGGGGGIMEAGNRGAAEAKRAPSVGLNIQLPYVQRMNKFVTHGTGFHYFFTRKVLLSAVGQAYVFFPGGFGTLDEFFEIITLIQTKKMEAIPVIAFGREYWTPLAQWIEAELINKLHAVDAAEKNIYTIVDTVEEAVKIIKRSKSRETF